MTGGRLLTKLLKFKGLRLVGWWFEGRSNFIIVVKPYKNGSRCPSCDRRGKVIRTMPARRWRDLPIREWSVFLQYAPREIRCPTHGRLVERIPWAERSSRVTYRFEYALLRHCQVMTQRAAAELLVIPKSPFRTCCTERSPGSEKGTSYEDLKPSASMRFPMPRVTNTPPSSTIWTGPASFG